MNIQQIEYVIAVSESKNFGRAADKCCITQSTLSTMVGRFEGEIGIKIFDRKTKPVTITQEGGRILQQLKIISKEIANLKEIVADLKGETSGELKIGIIPTVAPYLLPRFLSKFIKRFPDIHFVISEITTEKIIETLGNRELDIGIVSIPLKKPELIEIPVYQEPFLLYDRGDEKPNGHLHASSIDCDRLWLLEDGHCLRAQTESICGLHEKRVVNRNFDYKSGTIDTLLRFVNKNKGVTLLPYLATLDLDRKDHKYLKSFAEPIPVRSIGLLVHKHFVKKGILNLLKQEIQDQVMPMMRESGREQDVISPV